MTNNNAKPKLSSNPNPIGIFDSGVGGLSVAFSIRQELANENLLYIADSANAPYGNKSEQFLYQRSAALVQFLLDKKAKAIVACNTATVSVIKQLRCDFSIPIIGIEPGLTPAIAASKNGIIGVMATEQTLKSKSFNELNKSLSTNVNVITQACPGLVEQIEKMSLQSEETELLLRKYLAPLLDKGIDTLVLGCTHYSFISPLLRQITGKDITIINTNSAVAKQVSRRLKTTGLLSSTTIPGNETDRKSVV